MSEMSAQVAGQLRETLERAYAPYSGFVVACALRTVQGRWFFGCNVETAHYKAVCAEAGALSAMVAAGERRVEAVYIAAASHPLCPPCGDCRQRLLEFAVPGLQVHLLDSELRAAASHTIEALLPVAFRSP